MSLCIIGLDTDGSVITGNSRLKLFEGLQGIAFVDECIDVIWLEADCLVITAQRSFIMKLLFEHKPSIEISLCAIAFQLNCLCNTLHRFIKAFLPSKDDSFIQINFMIIGVECGGFFITDQCFVRLIDGLHSKGKIGRLFGLT